MDRERKWGFHISAGDEPGTFDVGFEDAEGNFEGIECTLDEMRDIRDGFNAAIRSLEVN